MSLAQAQGRADPANWYLGGFWHGGAHCGFSIVVVLHDVVGGGPSTNEDGAPIRRRHGIYHAESTNREPVLMHSIAKLFTHDGSQAVRLPKEFRFEGKEVRISRIGDRVILEPVGELRPMPWDQIDRIGDTPFMSEERDQPPVPVDRVVFE
jgi:antitoxin VapB